MEKIRMITDTLSDIPADATGDYELELIPAPVYDDSIPILENIDRPGEDLLALLRENKKLRVGHIPAAVYLDRFKLAFAHQYHRVIVVTPAEQFSGIYRAACEAREMFFEQVPDAREVMAIDVVDSGSYSIGYGLPVLRASEKIMAGATGTEVLEFLKESFNQTELYVTTFSMKGVFSSGIFEALRLLTLQVTKSFPVCVIRGGKITALDSDRGEDRTYEDFIQYCRKALDGTQPYAIFYADPAERAHELGEILTSASRRKPEGYYQVSAATAVSLGTDCIGMAKFGPLA